MIFVFWLIFAVVVAVLAGKRGRSGILWFGIAAALSPLVAGIILFVMPDLEAEREDEEMKEEQAHMRAIESKKVEQQKATDALKIKSSDLTSSFNKLQQLCAGNILTEAEFSDRKSRFIAGMKDKIIDESPEDFLSAMIPLIENKVMTKEELGEIKTIIYTN